MSDLHPKSQNDNSPGALCKSGQSHAWVLPYVHFVGQKEMPAGTASV